MLFFFFNDTATTEIYTLSLHDALPISHIRSAEDVLPAVAAVLRVPVEGDEGAADVLVPHIGDQRMLLVMDNFEQVRSEEHTSELQSRQYLVCRLLLEKKKSLIPLASMS